MFNLVLLNTLLVSFVLWTGSSAEDLRSGLELEFGTWHPLARCPEGSYANGFEVAAKDEVNKLFNDELAMTGMRLYCSQGTNHSENAIASYVMEGAGSWRGKSVCPDGEWIIGFRLRLANYMGVTKDDTATNDANVICSSGLALPGRGNVRGDWQQWANCSQGSVVCGLATKADDSGISLDKAGIVTVHLHCCSLDSNLTDAMELQSRENPLHSIPETSTKGDVKQNEMDKPSKALRSGILHEEAMSTNETTDTKHVGDSNSKEGLNHSDAPKTQDAPNAGIPKPEEHPNSNQFSNLSKISASPDKTTKEEPKMEPKPDENVIAKDTPVKLPA